MSNPNISRSGMPRPRPKSSVILAVILCPLLLAVSCFGFWKWVAIATAAHLAERDELFSMLCLTVLPLVIILFLAVVAAQRLEYNRLSNSYQVRMDQLQKRLNHQDDFLHSMMDNNPEAIAIFDKGNNYWFVNHATAKLLNADIKDIIGKSPAKLLSPDRAKRLDARLSDVRVNNRNLEMLHQLPGKDGKVCFMQAHYEPLAPFGEFSGGVIVRAEDVTNLMVERERRENMLRQVIGTLVAVVDRRDPYASGHSARVGQLSRVIAEEMVQSEKDIEASEIAGSLMNFGKVLVPREILTKTSALTAEELQNIRDSILTSADILSLIDFSGPVVPTLKQVLERYDGSGAPNGLKGEQILMTSRIVTVANAYVAMVSPRAHRPSLGIKDAVQVMLKDENKNFDAKVVKALANYIENSPNKLDWIRTGKPS